MLNLKIWLKKNSYLIAATLFVVGVLVYTLLSFYYAHHMVVTMDEGTYLIKGKWYLDGTYRPFQEQGPVTNKLPFSFWVPGLSQVLFGMGIRSGRYFSIFQSVLILVGLWLTARRFSSPWVGTILVWACVLNQNWIMFYARPMSQVTTAVFTVWSLYFVLGQDRKIWQVVIGVLLAIFTVLTRHNMIPLTAMTCLYVLWEHGWKKGGLSVTVGGLFFILFHIFYWPGIYYMIWRAALPGFITSALFDWGLLVDPVLKMDGDLIFRSEYPALAIVQELFGGVRYSLLPVWFMALGFIVYPFRKLFASSQFKPFIFLLGSYLVITLAHVWAVVTLNSILYSFPGYFAFYNPVGLLLAPFLYETLSKNISKLKGVGLAFLVLVFSAGIGMHQYRPLSTFLLSLGVPRIRDFRFEPGTVELWRLVANKFGLEYFDQEPWVTALAGLLAGFLIILIAFVFWLLQRKHKVSYAWALISVFSIIAFVASPTAVLSGSGAAFICETDTIQSYEEVGASLRAVIPDGSLVYWGSQAQPSPAILLYLPEVRTFPAQLNGYFYYREGGTTEIALKKNYWNEELAERWLLEADYVLLSDAAAASWNSFMNDTHAGKFKELEPTDPVYTCDKKSVVRVYKVVK